MKPINTILNKYKIKSADISLYDQYIAKIKPILAQPNKNKKLILVTATSPTPAGEGKTTVSIGLNDALNKIGKKSIVALREPSMGPVFGVKGGANGGGKAQVVPKDEIDLHFTGDFHAITAANNLIAACIDNHIYWGNELKIDPKKIVWKRVIDTNDRSLRDITVNIDKKTKYNTSFDITVASELMAILCLAQDEKDLKQRIERIIVAYNTSDEPIYVKDLNIVGAILKILKTAIYPNAVQSLEGNLALIHGGPFANIAHGCNSIIATKTAMNIAEYTVTEAGFGSDLGAEKFLDIVCNEAKLQPNAVVLVTSIKSLKYHGGVDNAKDWSKENIKALQNGFKNLQQHINNIKAFGCPLIVAINKFSYDTANEVKQLTNYLTEQKINYSVVDVFTNGSTGGVDLAKQVDKLANVNYKLIPTYKIDELLKVKIEKIVKRCYGGVRVEYSDLAVAKISQFTKLPAYVCIAKTPLTFSDNPKEIIIKKPIVLHVRDLILANGANFIIVLAGNIFRMPGLPKVPNACNM